MLATTLAIPYMPLSKLTAVRGLVLVESLKTLIGGVKTLLMESFNDEKACLLVYLTLLGTSDEFKILRACCKFECLLKQSDVNLLCLNTLPV